VIRSMTGYGSARADSDALRLSVTARSVNHRYLDLSLNLPRTLQALEGDVKRLVQSHVHRGRVEVHVSARLSREGAGVEVGSFPYVRSLVETLRGLQKEHGLSGEVRLTEVMRFPGVLEVVEPDVEISEETRSEVMGGVDRALAALDEMRREEGESLRTALAEILAAIEAAAGRIAALWEQERGSRTAALLERLRGVREELGLEEGRLYQETVRFVDRQDVAEELQRLGSHLGQARGLLERPGPAGKSLDFLTQEMAREATTIGSKSQAGAVTREVVALRAEVEKLREQVQNVE
jgi:uncharacterized protein (TIGR00255 family)